MSAALGARGRVLVIVGTTGVGKTKLSLELARAFGGEVINCDAMQVRGSKQGPEPAERLSF